MSQCTSQFERAQRIAGTRNWYCWTQKTSLWFYSVRYAHHHTRTKHISLLKNTSMLPTYVPLHDEDAHHPHNNYAGANNNGSDYSSMKPIKTMKVGSRYSQGRRHTMNSNSNNDNDRHPHWMMLFSQWMEATWTTTSRKSLKSQKPPAMPQSSSRSMEFSIPVMMTMVRSMAMGHSLYKDKYHVSSWWQHRIHVSQALLFFLCFCCCCFFLYGWWGAGRPLSVFFDRTSTVIQTNASVIGLPHQRTIHSSTHTIATLHTVADDRGYHHQRQHLQQEQQQNIEYRPLPNLPLQFDVTESLKRTSALQDLYLMAAYNLAEAEMVQRDTLIQWTQEIVQQQHESNYISSPAIDDMRHSQQQNAVKSRHANTGAREETIRDQYGVDVTRKVYFPHLGATPVARDRERIIRPVMPYQLPPPLDGPSSSSSTAWHIHDMTLMVQDQMPIDLFQQKNPFIWNHESTETRQSAYQWNQEWHEYQLRAKATGSHPRPGAVVDYTTPSKYTYPTIHLHPPSSTEYPKFRTTTEIFQEWPQNSDHVGVIHETLMHFNYSDPVQRAASIRYRDLELPFKLYDIPDLVSVHDLWTDEYLIEQTDHTPHTLKNFLSVVQESVNNFFLFFLLWDTRTAGMPSIRQSKGMGMEEFIEHAIYADAVQLSAEQPHYYYQVQYY
jgi:hypothetical protein